jgi:hypothetical protein
MTSPEQIERDIENARQHLSDTIEDLRRCLTPKQLGAELVEATRRTAFLQKLCYRC